MKLVQIDSFRSKDNNIVIQGNPNHTTPSILSSISSTTVSAIVYRINAEFLVSEIYLARGWDAQNRTTRFMVTSAISEYKYFVLCVRTAVVTIHRDSVSVRACTHNKG